VNKQAMIEWRRSDVPSSLPAKAGVRPMALRDALALAGLLCAALLVDASLRVGRFVTHKPRVVGGLGHLRNIPMVSVERALGDRNAAAGTTDRQVWNAWMFVVELTLFPILLFSMILLLPIFSVVDICQRLSWKLPWMR
jgi:hypothetical protein